MDIVLYAATCPEGQEKMTAYRLLELLVTREYGLQQLPEMVRREGGKPWFPQYSQICFNVSHSRGAAVCAVHHLEIGVDVEKLRPAPRRLAAGMEDEDFFRLSQPIHYDIKFETETYRSGRKHIKKTRYKENPFGKIVGKHDGAQFYTIGQRKGLNIGGHKDSIFVIETDIPNNIIYVGEGHTHKGLSRSCLRVAPDEIHWIRPDLKMSVGEIRRYRVRIRYRQPLQDATVVMRENGMYILFDTPQRGITPGQFAVWYDGDEMIGSGVI